jgi:hypothetical protein
MNDLFGPLSRDALRLIHAVPALIDKTFPLPGRFRAGLPADVADLSRLLTADRGERELSYLSRPGRLSAYLRYFLPWNIFRLCRLLPNLEIDLSPGDSILDLGCGPLSLAVALWISRPDLRKISLEIRCVDSTAPVLEAGRKFFAALAGQDCPWKIITIRGNISPAGTIGYSVGHKSGKAHGDKSAAGRKPAVMRKPAAGRGSSAERSPPTLVCAINVFNEIYRKIPAADREGIQKAAAFSARLLDSCAAESGSILVVEPGVPFSGEFISCLRSALLEKNRFPRSPCPHCETCPFPGGVSGAGKKRWCHFACDTEDAPVALHRLSAAAGIPKDRAVLSFLYAGGSHDGNSRSPEGEPVRIISEAFPLSDGQFGRYGCSRQGLILAVGKRFVMEACVSGALVTVELSGQRDRKSGALLAEIDQGTSKTFSF